MKIPTHDELMALLPTQDHGQVKVTEYDDRTEIHFHWRNRPHQTSMLIGQVCGITLTVMHADADALQRMLDEVKRIMADAYAQSFKP